MWPSFFLIAVIALLAVGRGLYLVGRDDRKARPWSIVAGVAAVALPVSIVAHNVISGLTGRDEVLSFLLAVLVVPAGFAIGAFGAGIVTWRRDRTLGGAMALSGAGMGVFLAYMMVALAVTTIGGGSLDYEGPIESVVVSAAAIALITGALGVTWSFRGRTLAI